MTAAEKSRRWESAGHMTYVPTAERQKRSAETPIEQRAHDTAQEQYLQRVPDLVPLPSEVPRSGRIDIEDIAMPSQ